MSAPAGPAPTWLRWLHRLGYVTTALVVVVLLAIASLMLWLRFKPDRPWDGKAEQAELQAKWERWGEWGGDAVLASLPDRAEMSGDGLRLVIMPSFSDWYGLALYRDRQGRGSMMLTRFQQPLFGPDDPLPPVQIAVWTARSSDHVAQLAWFDSWIKRYGRASEVACVDGTPTAFERVTGDKITSGMGNCEKPYELLKQRMLALAKRHFPDAPLPADPGWH